MAFINENYLKLPGSYLFAEIARRVNAFKEVNPSADVIRLGIGDVTLPLPQVSIEAMHKAVDEMAVKETFRGYGPEQGYDFLIEAIREANYTSRGLKVDSDEIFVSDGSKSDCANIQEIFGLDNVVAIPDPVYPVYLDTNVMAGRTGELGADGHFAGVSYLPCTAESGFAPSMPEGHVDMIYLCSPNNPTGTTVPRSIYEIEGAREVAIEFRSFSKTAGFTGTRCGYTVVPKELMAYTKNGEARDLRSLWNRRHTTKFNGTPYIIQRGAAAIYTKEGQAQIKELVGYYMENARIIREGLTSAGLTCFGGVNAPYIWLQTPNNMPSWDFFNKLLSEANIVGTPGAGFGSCGEGYFRLTAFGDRENTLRAVERFKNLKL